MSEREREPSTGESEQERATRGGVERQRGRVEHPRGSERE